VQNIVKEQTGRLPPAEFRKGLDCALQFRQAGKYLWEQGRPKTMRKNLHGFLEVLLKANEHLNRLDGNSRQLLATKGSIESLYDHLDDLIRPVSEAHMEVQKMSKTRAGIRDLSAANMGGLLAAITWLLLGQEPTSTQDGLFSSLYKILAEVSGTSPDDKAVKAAIEYWKESREDLLFSARALFKKN
jgi:hypothetical protein